MDTAASKQLRTVTYKLHPPLIVIVFREQHTVLLQLHVGPTGTVYCRQPLRRDSFVF